MFEMSGQLHDPDALSAGNSPRYSLDRMSVGPRICLEDVEETEGFKHYRESTPIKLSLCLINHLWENRSSTYS
jgi:hypothetical protein